MKRKHKNRDRAKPLDVAATARVLVQQRITGDNEGLRRKIVQQDGPARWARLFIERQPMEIEP